MKSFETQTISFCKTIIDSLNYELSLKNKKNLTGISNINFCRIYLIKVGYYFNNGKNLRKIF